MATIKDVAKLAGVGVGTVSRHLSGNAPVSNKSGEKIAAAMAELNYRPNSMARSLSSKRSNIIGLWVPSFSGSFHRKMLQTIGGDCDTAIGGLAEIQNHNLKLKAQLFSDSGQESFEYELTGREVDASFIGKSVGEKLLDLAGEKFKKK